MMRTSVRVMELTPTEKGALAETEITAAAVRLGYVVSKPLTEGRRYDLIVDTGPRVLRVQCKWAQLLGDVLSIRLCTSRYTPSGYVRTWYDSTQIDAVVAYSPDLDHCYLIPIQEVTGRSNVYLRIRPTRNNQAIGVKWAADYDFGAIAQLGERSAGSRKVEGSNPSSSTPEAALQGGLFDVYEEERANGSPRG
jgi:PD-(D/E)XK nuclease superfamily protein